MPGFGVEADDAADCCTGVRAMSVSLDNSPPDDGWGWGFGVVVTPRKIHDDESSGCFAVVTVVIGGSAPRSGDEVSVSSSLLNSLGGERRRGDLYGDDDVRAPPSAGGVFRSSPGRLGGGIESSSVSGWVSDPWESIVRSIRG